MLVVVAALACACSSTPNRPARTVVVAVDTDEGAACLADCRAAGGDTNACKLTCPEACWNDDAICNSTVDRRIAERKRIRETPTSHADCLDKSQGRYKQCIARIAEYRQDTAGAVMLGGLGDGPNQAAANVERTTDRATNECRFRFNMAVEQCRAEWMTPQRAPDP